MLYDLFGFERLKTWWLYAWGLVSSERSTFRKGCPSRKAFFYGRIKNE
jgi:hypothetical protein